MSITTVLFDLDGTLLPMDQEVFVKHYFGGLAGKLAPYGYDPQGLVAAIWKGTEAMVRNDGSRLNEKCFWETFCASYGRDATGDAYLFDEFYRDDFDKVREACGYNPLARKFVDKLKSLGYRVALATNPIFPSVATEARIRWAGFEPSDFEIFTTYENSSFCKPNPDYYREVIGRLGVSADECLMVGNDVEEDMVAEHLGMKVFLLTDCIINKNGRDISVYPHGSFDALAEYCMTSLD